MIDPAQFEAEVVRPTLETIRLESEAAVRLLVVTAIAESGLVYLRQHRGGPARGLFQIEPATMHDVLDRYLAGRPDLMFVVRPLMNGEAPVEQLTTNLKFACAIARLRYWMDPHPLPSIHDPAAMGAYWKRVYNTPLGAGNAAKFAALYRRFYPDEEARP